MSAFFSKASSVQGRLALALALAVAVPVASRAAEPAQLAEKTSEELNKLPPLTAAKNWDGALALLNGLQPTVAPTSFDYAIIADVKSKIYMQKGDYPKAIEPMETAIRLADAYGYFDEHDVADKVYLLVQIYYQEATNTKSPATQQQYFNKAAGYIKRWLASKTGKTSPDASRQEAALLYASILYNQAIVNPEKIDGGILKQAEQQVEAGLLGSVRPKENFYILLIACLQQESNYLRAAEILELYVKDYPSKKDYWAQLVATYVNLAITEKDDEKARMFNIRAILATERSQALGFAKSQKDNFNLVGIYINLGQYGKATELLYSGLKNGGIESTQKNWEYLAYCYQQVDKPYQAIDVLKEATALFPKAGQLDYQAAQIYYALDKTEEAYRALNAAVAKGRLDKPSAVYNFLGYLGYELRHFDEALVAIDKAISFQDSASDTQLPRLRDAIVSAKKEQDDLKAMNAPKPQ